MRQTGMTRIAATIRRQRSGYAVSAAWRNEKLFRDPAQPTREVKVFIAGQTSAVTAVRPVNPRDRCRCGRSDYAGTIRILPGI
jgi:hypothetical protein